MHNGKVASFNVQHESVRAPGHEQVLAMVQLKADQGVLRKGLIIVLDPSDQGIPLDTLSAVLGTGNGSTKNFSGILSGFPLEPGSVEITDGVETFFDDGLGNLIGSAGGSGTAIYKTGAVSVSFNTAVPNATDIQMSGAGEIKGVLDRDVDTAKSTNGAAIIHGTVKEELLKKGSVSLAPAETAEFKLLNKRGIYPV